MNMLSVEQAMEGIVAGAVGSRFVLIGEASHGTHEFYDLRAELTKRLIEERSAPSLQRPIGRMHTA
jgi:erythromycin esterase-like protein